MNLIPVRFRSRFIPRAIASTVCIVALVCVGVARAGVPAPFEVIVEKGVMVPMRDGTRLATDLYRPARAGRPIEGRLPTVLLRTPYNKAKWRPNLSRFFASHGYLAVAQDTRGRFNSEGKWMPFLQEPEDGYDTIQWIAGHPRSNGRVGMHGPSFDINPNTGDPNDRRPRVARNCVYHDREHPSAIVLPVLQERHSARR